VNFGEFAERVVYELFMRVCARVCVCESNLILLQSFNISRDLALNFAFFLRNKMHLNTSASMKDAFCVVVALSYCLGGICDSLRTIVLFGICF